MRSCASWWPTCAARRRASPASRCWSGMRRLSARSAAGSWSGRRWPPRALLLEPDAPRARLQRYVLGADVGQCCGGVVEVWMERYDARGPGLAAGCPAVRAARPGDAGDAPGGRRRAAPTCAPKRAEAAIRLAAPGRGSGGGPRAPGRALPAAVALRRGTRRPGAGADPGGSAAAADLDRFPQRHVSSRRPGAGATCCTAPIRRRASPGRPRAAASW